MSASRVPPDELFQVLDGQFLSVDGRDWHVCVFSITDTNQSRWVQLTLEGQGRHVLTLHLSPDQAPRQAVGALCRFLSNPLATTEVLSHVA